MASKASATAIILAPSGSCKPLAARPPRLPSYQAGMLSTISRTRRDAQLRRRMLRLILRERAMMAASFSSSVPGFNRISSGAPIMPTSCSSAAISMSSRSSSGQIHLHRPTRTRQRHAQGMSGYGRILALQGGEQTGRDSQASLHQPVVDRLAEHRRQHLAATVITSNSLSRVWSSVIQRSADSGAVGISAAGSDCGSRGVSETLLMGANFKGDGSCPIVERPQARPRAAGRQFRAGRSLKT